MSIKCVRGSVMTCRFDLQWRAL